MSDTSIPSDPEHGAAAAATTPSGAATRPAGPQQVPPPLGGSATDKSFTIVLIALGPLACLVGSFWGAFSVMATASCGSGCGAGADWAIWLMILGPWVVWLASSIWAVVRLVRKKPAVWIMVAGVALSLLTYVFANILLSVAVG